MMISYAQNFEDVLLWRCLKHVAAGTYVDIGAHHSEIDSVTKWLYDQGWSGINVEAIPYLAAEIAAARPRDTTLAVAAGAVPGHATLYHFPDAPGLSTLDETIARAAGRSSEPLTVEVRTLRDILAPLEGQEIHILKIDVEGAERDVLSGMDFRRFRPWILVVESAPPEGIGPAPQSWDDLVLPFGYRQVWFDGLNRFLIAEEHADLAWPMTVPPNVFDHFETASLVRERKAREASEASQARLSEAVTIRDDRIHELDTLLAQQVRDDAGIATREQRLADLGGQLDLRDQRIAELGREVRLRDERIAQLGDEMRLRDTRIAQLGDEVRLRDERLDEIEQARSARLQDLERDFAFQRDAYQALHTEMQSFEHYVRDMETKLDVAQTHAEALEQSYSWRMTAPVRALSTRLRHLLIHRKRWTRQPG